MDLVPVATQAPKTTFVMDDVSKVTVMIRIQHTVIIDDDNDGKA